MVFFKSDNIISSLGFSTNENFEALRCGKIGIEQVDDINYYPDIFQASMIDVTRLENEFSIIANKYSNFDKYTKLEKMLIISISHALSYTDVDISSMHTGIVLSTTKGNIDLLDQVGQGNVENSRVLLWKLGDIIQNFFGNPNKTIVISNACVSGVIAINTAAMLINLDKFDNVIVTGADLVSKFVVSGFMSFMSLSPDPCKPFDRNRDGLSLGEAASTIIIGNKSDSDKEKLVFMGGSSANDANHISGPSRTGEGSYIAIKKAMIEAKIEASEIDHISAHGTATPYNDEMESIAIDRHGLSNVPVNSIKGSLGHTLGAAGIVETAILIQEMNHNEILKTQGYKEHGVSRDINIVGKNQIKNLDTCLKMASGFGGSNAAIIIAKIK